MHRALEGVTVVDLTQFAAGPYCTMLLADAGARVIKVEPPRGEPYRHEGPPICDSAGTQTGSYILRFSRHKESVALDLKDADDRGVFFELVRRADVLVQNFKPDTTARLGLRYTDLQPLNDRLIYASVTGFGQADFLPSPHRQGSAFAVVSEAMGGVMDMLGDAGCPPHWSGVSLGDLFPGSLAVAGILIALLQRGRTGLGQQVDISMVDCMTSLNEKALLAYTTSGVESSRGLAHTAPCGPFRASDRWIAVAVAGEACWRQLCTVIDRADLLRDVRLAAEVDRAGPYRNVVTAAVDQWARKRTADDAVTTLTAHGIGAAIVATAQDTVRSPHAEARRMLLDVEYGGWGSHLVIDSPIKMSGSPPRPTATIPLLGEHTDRVRSELARPLQDTTNKSND
jgi:CoA:oxalate CoA-transferase